MLFNGLKELNQCGNEYTELLIVQKRRVNRLFKGQYAYKKIDKI